MARFIVGDLVVVPFPFSDLSGSQRRPALVIATLAGDDVILCQITSQARSDEYAIPLEPADLVSGELKLSSFIRTNKLFTFDSKAVLYKMGYLSSEKIDAVKEKVIAIFSNFNT